jgi:hypothetical protein
MPRTPTFTFKQFLESDDPLQDIERAMIIRKLIPSLKSQEALDVLHWVEDRGIPGMHASYDDLPDAVSEKIANSLFAETDVTGKSMDGVPDHKAAPIIRGKIQSMMWDMLNGMKLKESDDPLLDTQVEMFFRKELSLPKEEAAEAMQWITGEKFWKDLSSDTRDHVLDYVSQDINPNIYKLAPGYLPQHCQDELVRLMRDKYRIGS